MPKQEEVDSWAEKIRTRYENYLKTSFYFKNPALRASFDSALHDYDLVKGPIREPAQRFDLGATAEKLAAEIFPGCHENLLPALQIENEFPKLRFHQEQALRSVHQKNKNIVVATGTASGKTESFLYPILFELYRQHLSGELKEQGVRAMILYPMNALANDQRERMGAICKSLKDAGSDFKPTFGQYIGETPEHENDRRRSAKDKENNRLPYELVFRKEMREKPPHILLTNYSMLEYLLIRPKDTELFDNGLGKYWQFIVLDEAHQYRGVKGMEIGMLIRRLKQRLRKGGRGTSAPFRCIATSATLSSGEGEKQKQDVSNFAGHLFGEEFCPSNIIFGKKYPDKKPQRFHLFIRALEGAFLSHENGKDKILLNRKSGDETSVPIEIALCRECGEHYYVGREESGYLVEAKRDPGGKIDVGFYRQSDEEKNCLWLCRVCGKISKHNPNCECDAVIKVKECEVSEDDPDQMKKCDACGYTRGNIGDPVQEIVRGTDGPNTVIASALHELLPEERRKILSFADNRQEAAFFAWYAQDSYQSIRDRNLMLRALRAKHAGSEGLSLKGWANRLNNLKEAQILFSRNDTADDKNRILLEIILRESVTTERRLSLAGVGLIKWEVKIPDSLKLPPLLSETPWGFSETETLDLLHFLLNDLRIRQALELPGGVDAPNPDKIFISTWNQQREVCYELPTGQRNRLEEGNRSAFAWQSKNFQSTASKFLLKLLAERNIKDKNAREHATKLLFKLWQCIQNHDDDVHDDDEKILSPVSGSNTSVRLNSKYLRAHEISSVENVFKCNVCGNINSINIRDICPRPNCKGTLKPADTELEKNHYRRLYQVLDMPLELRSEEHTAQINPDEARKRQNRFKNGKIHLLSASTTFEVGVDLGELETTFLRNVPPEPFNYTQRVGRAGRRDSPGLALTYCRRNPHDLYHYQDPEKRLIKGETHAPQLHLQNKRIIVRHMTAVALSMFFKYGENSERFGNMACFVRDWENPRATKDFKEFCRDNCDDLENALKLVVPEKMHDSMGLLNGQWIKFITEADDETNGGRCLQAAEEETRQDYLQLLNLWKKYSENHKDKAAGQLANKMRIAMDDIRDEKVLTFLSRKAVIPKYGFPVDVVELDVSRARDSKGHNVSLQRDLSQAIAEYAPGCRVIANKKEWVSSGVKIVPGKELPTKQYTHDDSRGYYNEWDDNKNSSGKRYICPQFGFISAKKPKDPSVRPRRFYTTRPFFLEFDSENPKEITTNGVRVTEASPGRMVVLCEGERGNRFHICMTCGYGPDMKRSHNTPFGLPCNNPKMKQLALGHKFVTDVVRMSFDNLHDQWKAYSLAYAVLLGVSDALDVPAADLNTTITGLDGGATLAIVLYDNVPGGAGLVANLKNQTKLIEALEHARERVSGNCGCDESCYGCLRSYRNQFAHAHLQRKEALNILEKVLQQQ